MQQRSGMGETGESYLIADDFLMRSDSFLDPVNHSVTASFKSPATGSVKSDAAKAALGGAVGSDIVIDYNGNPVLSAYAPLDLFGMKWAILAEIDEAEAFAAVTRLQWQVGGVLGVAVALIFVIGFFTARSISAPILNIIGELTEGSAQITSAAGQISTSSQALAEGATEQASALEESSAALEEISAQTKSNAANAVKANGVSSDATSAADEGARSVEEMIVAMGDINAASAEISKIIKVIEEIAFQTNLLALNAAVEAARAGEHGKGFAVVAEEVRNLAQRAAAAAKDTSALIANAVDKAASGAATADQAGTALERIVASIAQVSGLIGEIAAASQEQTTGVDQVSKAVTEMDKVTQSNASVAEEAAAAAEELNAQAESVNEIVQRLGVVINGADVATGSGQPAAPSRRIPARTQR
jgi:methyl-accepting chemotaxis protein